jgi:DNA-binding MarR family transcriptional regulator
MVNDAPDSTEFELSRSPGHLLHRAQQFAAERFTTAMAGAKLTQRQFAVLSATSAQEGLTQTELVKATGIDRSTLAELVARMVRNGLLVREKVAEDARANAVRLSDEGRSLMDTASKAAMDADDAILAALPKSKRAGFLKTLRRIAVTLEKDERAVQKLRAKEKAQKKKNKKKSKARLKSEMDA